MNIHNTTAMKCFFINFFYLLLCVQSTNSSNIDYTHQQPESAISKIVKFFLSFIQVKALIENDLDSGNWNQDPSPFPECLKEKLNIDISEILDRKVWTIQSKTDNNTSKKVVIYLHGGAYIYNIAGIQWSFIEKLIEETGVTFVVPDYPLAPKAKCNETIAFMNTLYLETTSRFHSEDLIFMGDSAGGGLALSFTMYLKQQNETLPEQTILLSPWLDITMNNPDILRISEDDKILDIRYLQLAGELYAGELDHEDYRVSPIYGNFTGLSPISIFIGTDDILSADTEKLREIMRADELTLNYFEYPKMIHVWLLFLPIIRESRHALKEIVKLIEANDIQTNT